MYKIYKTPIAGFDPSQAYPQGVLAVNSNYRVTMGYVDSNKTINLTVDKLVKPDLNSAVDAPITYTTVATRAFTPADFVQYTDNMAWIVEFDAETETINNPFNVLSYTQTLIDSSTSHQNIWREIQARQSEKLFPCFQVESFYKTVTDFSASVLTFHVIEDGTPKATVIDSATTPAPVEMVAPDRIKDIIQNYFTHIVYQILDSSGNVLTDTQHIPLSDIGTFTAPGADPKKVAGDQFAVSLPAAAEYKIRVIYSNGLTDKTLSAQFDVNCINGVPSKTRLNSGLRKGQTSPDFTYLGPNNFPSRFAGYEDVIIDNKLSAGDYIKFKLDCGPQLTYSELAITLV
jgi:hypothetical protein